MVPVVLIVLLLLSIGFYEARKAYWDHRVTELCSKDAGVKVYEHVTLSAQDYERLGGTPYGLPLPSEEGAKGFPYFVQVAESKIHDGNPVVMRLETLVRRRSDGKLLARSITYFRRGGDFPTGLLHDSSFGCAQPEDLTKQIFKVGEEAK